MCEGVCVIERERERRKRERKKKRKREVRFANGLREGERMGKKIK